MHTYGEHNLRSTCRISDRTAYLTTSVTLSVQLQVNSFSLEMSDIIDLKNFRRISSLKGILVNVEVLLV
jgi:hypothetical protein